MTAINLNSKSSRQIRNLRLTKYGRCLITPENEREEPKTIKAQAWCVQEYIYLHMLQTRVHGTHRQNRKKKNKTHNSLSLASTDPKNIHRKVRLITAFTEIKIEFHD